MSAQVAVLSPQAQQALDVLAKRYGQKLAETAVNFIYSADEAEALTNREAFAASLYLHIFNGAARDEVIHHIGFMLEVAELRSIETLRPQGWNSLTETLRNMSHPTGGE